MRVSELAASDPWRSFQHRVVQVSAASPHPCPRREREAPTNHCVGASQAAITPTSFLSHPTTSYVLNVAFQKLFYKKST